MRALYVGILSQGTTSRLRADSLRAVTTDWDWTLLDTDRSFRPRSRLSRSLAFRLRTGSAVRAINRSAAAVGNGPHFDLIWVDKGVYLWPSTVKRLRNRAGVMIHYTPDTAFLHNQSRFFNAAASQYDLLVTTKSFEMHLYDQRVPSERLMLTTQSFDANLHRPRFDFAQKRHETVFIGLCEPDREACMSRLVEAGIPVRLGGQGWEHFLSRFRDHPLVAFEGARVFGNQYSEMLSQATVGLGLLTKRFPELHTTRTFEIPACGTALASERNEETSQFFESGEAIFFADYADLVDKLTGLWESPEQLEQIAKCGQSKVVSAGYDNDTVMRRILHRAGMD